MHARRKHKLGTFKPTREVLTRHGRRYYAARFFQELAPFLALPATAGAFAAFLRAADADPKLIRRNPPPSAQRRRRRQDSPVPNRKWEPWEDETLRNWFGKRTYGEHEGRHAPLTEHQWQLVLQEHLKGRRTRRQVKTRISILNRRLKRSMLVDGFIPRDMVRVYQDRALGEYRIPLPRYRPRIKGRSYLGEGRRVVPGQPA